MSTVEDERGVLTTCLESLGWTAHFAASESEARQLLAGRPVGIIFLDDDDPEHCWRSLMDLFRWRGPACPPCIVLSSRADNRLWAEVLNLGAYDLLPKPLEVAQLEWAIESLRISSRRAEPLQRQTKGKEQP
jgi:DNA-binding response OmpR family regulator